MLSKYSKIHEYISSKSKKNRISADKRLFIEDNQLTDISWQTFNLLLKICKFLVCDL